MYILQSLHGHLSAFQVPISDLNNSSDVAFLTALGTNSQIFRAVRRYGLCDQIYWPIASSS